MGIPGCVPIITKTLNNSSASCTNTKMQLTYTDTNTDTNTNTNTNKNTNKTWSLKKKTWWCNLAAKFDSTGRKDDYVG